MKDGNSFRRFNRNRELIPDGWRCYRESTFADIELSFRNKKLFRNKDDVWILEKSDKKVD